MDLNEYIESIREKRICVIGAGVSNRPFIRLLLLSGCSVTVCDMKEHSQLSQDDLDLIGLGAHYRLGKDYLEDLRYDLIFRTPGLMPFDRHLEEARRNGSEITSEMEVFFRLCPCRTVAVTGSDGKTTTTTIIAELLRREGYTVHLGGNIGKPLLCELPFMKPEDFAVTELSSFQLHSMDCSPDVALITNISPNHLDKHRDYQDYIDAKKNIFLRQKEDACLVLNADNELCCGFEKEAPVRSVFFSVKGPVKNGYYLQNGVVFRAEDGLLEKVLDASAIAIPGIHNVANYLAAFCATDAFIGQETRAYVAESFHGVEHRLEIVRRLHGVTYINDSIGTSPTRTIAGLRALDRKPMIILGGYDKHLDFTELGNEVCLRAKAAFITGATADKILTAVTSSPFYHAEDLPVVLDRDFFSCVQKAFDSAEEGDIVLLSPACAAFDSFQNFEERGRTFKKMVLELSE